MAQSSIPQIPIISATMTRPPQGDCPLFVPQLWVCQVTNLLQNSPNFLK